MNELTLQIDRGTDPEISIVTAFVSGIKIGDSYFFDIAKPDWEIESEVRADLITKGYIFI